MQLRGHIFDRDNSQAIRFLKNDASKKQLTKTQKQYLKR